ncbi:MAG: hypothetical protein ACXV8O_04970 [Methylobacter sp.]
MPEPVDQHGTSYGAYCRAQCINWPLHAAQYAIAIAPYELLHPTRAVGLLRAKSRARVVISGNSSSRSASADPARGNHVERRTSQTSAAACCAVITGTSAVRVKACQKRGRFRRQLGLASI